MIKKVIWASMIDYPNNIATVLFFDKCNFNCSYCYNKSLKQEKEIDFGKVILPKLIKRKEFINHVILTGGEPTIDEEFENITNTLFDNGFIIGIHTNGSNPKVIQNNIDKIDFFGIDVKSSKEKYNKITNVEIDFEKIIQTIKIVVASNKKIEIRTTIFPKYVGVEDCIKIVNKIRELGIKEYQLQQFYAVNGAEQVTSYSDKELVKIQERCNIVLPTKLKTK